MFRNPTLSNSAWLIADKVVRLGVGLVFWVWFARHFGPETFGLWNYAIAFTALFGAFAALGLDGVVVRTLTAGDVHAGAVLGTAFGLRLMAGILAVLAAVMTILFVRPGDVLARWLVTLNAVTFVLQSAQVLDFHFQAALRTRPAVIAVNAAFLLTMILRLMLLAFDADIVWFGVTLCIEAALAALLLFLAYRSDREADRLWRFDTGLAKQLLIESWPLLLSGLAVMVYMRVDQVMLASLAGDRAVGQFSASLRIAEVWYFIPMAIVTAAFPTMMKERGRDRAAYARYVQSLYDATAWLGVGVATLATLLGWWVLPMLYGPGYEEAPRILSVQIWAGVPVAMAFVHGKWLLAEGLQRYNLHYTVAGLFINVLMNILLIPSYGAIGAAWATLLTQVCPVLLQAFIPAARPNLVSMLKAFGAPWRLALRSRDVAANWR